MHQKLPKKNIRKRSNTKIRGSRRILGFFGGLGSLGGLFSFRSSGLLGQQNGVDVGQDSAAGNGDTLKQFTQFLVVPHSQQQVPRVDPVLLVVT